MADPLKIHEMLEAASMLADVADMLRTKHSHPDVPESVRLAWERAVDACGDLYQAVGAYRFSIDGKK